MEIIIGREKTAQPGRPAGRLELTVNGKKTHYGAYQSVDQHVSGQHCQLTLNADGTLTLKNLKMQNYTYVNGNEVHSKVVTMNDTVVLGGGGYVLPWEAIRPLLPKQVSVKPLEQVFNHFNEMKEELDIKQRKLNAYKTVTSVLSTLAIALGMLLGSVGGFSGSKIAITLPLYLIVIAANVYFTYRAFRDASRIPDQQKKLKEKFQNECVCPGTNNDGTPCARYFGGYGFYKNLPPQCPYCKSMLTQ